MSDFFFLGNVCFSTSAFFSGPVFFRSTLFQKSVFSKVSVFGEMDCFQKCVVFEKIPRTISGSGGGVGGDSGRFEAGVFFGLLSLFRLSGAVQFGVAVLEMRRTRGGCADKSEGFGRCAE